MRSVSSAKVAIAVGVLLVLAGAVKSWWPFVSIDRTVVTSSPSPGPLGADRIDIPVRAGSRICVGPLTIGRSSDIAAFTVASPASGTARLSVIAAGPGYRRNAALDLELLRSGTPVAAPVGSPPRVVSPGRVCVRNAGQRRVAMVGTNNPSWIGPARTSVDGRELSNQGMALALLEERRQSIVDRLGTIVRHATDLTGGAVPFALGWLIVVGFVVGTPLAILAVYWRGIRDDERH